MTLPICKSPERSDEPENFLKEIMKEQSEWCKKCQGWPCRGPSLGKNDLLVLEIDFILKEVMHKDKERTQNSRKYKGGNRLRS